MLYEWRPIYYTQFKTGFLKKTHNYVEKRKIFQKRFNTKFTFTDAIIVIINFLIENVLTVKFPDKINRSFDSRQPIVYRPMKID